MAVAHRQRNLRFARTCYDHLAGVAGVALADGLLAHGLVDNRDGLCLTATGRAALTGAGVDLGPRSRRPALRECIDWTERRPHLAGEIGAAICRHAFGAGWIERIGSGRAVRVTLAGVRDLKRHFGVVIDPAERDRSVAGGAGDPAELNESAAGAVTGRAEPSAAGAVSDPGERERSAAALAVPAGAPRP